MPFEKGQSGNPGGRPKKVPAHVARVRELEPKVLKRVEQILDDEKADPKDVMSAARFVYEYSRGKPRQQLELSGPGGEPIPISVDARKVLADPAVRAAIQQSVISSTGDVPK